MAYCHHECLSSVCKIKDHCRIHDFVPPRVSTPTEVDDVCGEEVCAVCGNIHPCGTTQFRTFLQTAGNSPGEERCLTRMNSASEQALVGKSCTQVKMFRCPKSVCSHRFLACCSDNEPGGVSSGVNNKNKLSRNASCHMTDDTSARQAKNCGCFSCKTSNFYSESCPMPISTRKRVHLKATQTENVLSHDIRGIASFKSCNGAPDDSQQRNECAEFSRDSHTEHYNNKYDVDNQEKVTCELKGVNQNTKERLRSYKHSIMSPEEVKPLGSTEVKYMRTKQTPKKFKLVRGKLVEVNDGSRRERAEPGTQSKFAGEQEICINQNAVKEEIYSCGSQSSVLMNRFRDMDYSLDDFTPSEETTNNGNGKQYPWFSSNIPNNSTFCSSRGTTVKERDRLGSILKKNISPSVVHNSPSCIVHPSDEADSYTNSMSERKDQHTKTMYMYKYKYKYKYKCPCTTNVNSSISNMETLARQNSSYTKRMKNCSEPLQEQEPSIKSEPKASVRFMNNKESYASSQKMSCLSSSLIIPKSSKLNVPNYYFPESKQSESGVIKDASLCRNSVLCFHEGENTLGNKFSSSVAKEQNAVLPVNVRHVDDNLKHTAYEESSAQHLSSFSFPPHLQLTSHIPKENDVHVEKGRTIPEEMDACDEGAQGRGNVLIQTQQVRTTVDNHNTSSARDLTEETQSLSYGLSKEENVGTTNNVKVESKTAISAKSTFPEYVEFEQNCMTQQGGDNQNMQVSLDMLKLKLCMNNSSISKNDDNKLQNEKIHESTTLYNQIPLTCEYRTSVNYERNLGKNCNIIGKSLAPLQHNSCIYGEETEVSSKRSMIPEGKRSDIADFPIPIDSADQSENTNVKESFGEGSKYLLVKSNDNSHNNQHACDEDSLSETEISELEGECEGEKEIVSGTLKEVFSTGPRENSNIDLTDDNAAYYKQSFADDICDKTEKIVVPGSCENNNSREFRPKEEICNEKSVLEQEITSVTSNGDEKKVCILIQDSEETNRNSMVLIKCAETKSPDATVFHENAGIAASLVTKKFHSVGHVALVEIVADTSECEKEESVSYLEGESHTGDNDSYACCKHLGAAGEIDELLQESDSETESAIDDSGLSFQEYEPATKSEVLSDDSYSNGSDNSNATKKYAKRKYESSSCSSIEDPEQATEVQTIDYSNDNNETDGVDRTQIDTSETSIFLLDEQFSPTYAEGLSSRSSQHVDEVTTYCEKKQPYEHSLTISSIDEVTMQADEEVYSDVKNSDHETLSVTPEQSQTADNDNILSDPEKSVKSKSHLSLESDSPSKMLNYNDQKYQEDFASMKSDQSSTNSKRSEFLALLQDFQMSFSLQKSDTTECEKTIPKIQESNTETIPQIPTVDLENISCKFPSTEVFTANIDPLTLENISDTESNNQHAQQENPPTPLSESTGREIRTESDWANEKFVQSNQERDFGALATESNAVLELDTMELQTKSFKISECIESKNSDSLVSMCAKENNKTPESVTVDCTENVGRNNQRTIQTNVAEKHAGDRDTDQHDDSGTENIQKHDVKRNPNIHAKFGIDKPKNVSSSGASSEKKDANISVKKAMFGSAKRNILDALKLNTRNGDDETKNSKDSPRTNGGQLKKSKTDLSTPSSSAHKPRERTMSQQQDISKRRPKSVKKRS
ncbi:uncharacterized protein LOC134541177 [Bacillus rossius redtenbacheri]|uniref:uncharacterized protein LOC134541177 n=1 Tax=Bacillus rossius redtenbacheri TaxID=93214 RepID=UPI002FDD082C